MRADTAGFFWDDTKRPKPPPQAKPKRTPPPRTWEDANYLPYLAEARAFNVPLYTDQELVAAFWRHERFVFDVECYRNYFLVAFKSLVSGKVAYVESFNDSGLDTKKLSWLLSSFLTVGFYSLEYDVPICTVALGGADNNTLKEMSDAMVVRRERPQDILKAMKLRKLKIDHIDINNVAPLAVSLKTYGGRLHCKRLQDLPFKADTILTPDQAAIVRLYCINDLDTTADLYNSLAEPIKLREQLSIEYRVDLRSKSDPQVAEALVGEELKRMSGGQWPKRREIPADDFKFRYKIPSFLKYGTVLLQGLLAQIAVTDFIVDNNGYTGLPQTLENYELKIGSSQYTLGIGGLHSTEETIAHYSTEHFVLLDRDVTSFYPLIVLNQGLAPEHLGENFLIVYRMLVERRVSAKKRGDKQTAESLKIAVNGVFGKLGNPYSIFYSPELLIQVTLTGQLALLMLIERLELAGIAVVSANTDGIVTNCPRSRRKEFDAIVAQWEKETSFPTEETEYAAVFSRDVNNYLAIKSDMTTKGKGAYGNPWVEGGDVKKKYERLSKNPQNSVCMDAVEAYLTRSVPIETTINRCSNPTKFVSVRNVKGGGVKDGNYLGKVIRWYYAREEKGEIIYALNGYSVPRTVGAFPLMDMPNTVPVNLDRDWYIREAYTILQDIGFLPKEKKQ